MSSRSWVLVVAVALGATGLSCAQGVGSPAEKPAGRDLYAGEPVVVERRDTVYRYNADGTGTRMETEVVRVQSAVGVRSMSVVNVPYSAGRERVEVDYLRVRKRNGALVPTPAGDAQDQVVPVTQVDPQYSDMHVLRIGARSLGVGDRLEFEIRTVFTAAQAKGEFWGFESLGRGPVTLERHVELRVPASRNVLVDSPGHPADVSEDGPEKVFRWTGAQTKPTVVRAGATGTAGAGSAGEEEDGRPAIAWTTFPNWAAVATWYRGLSGPVAAPAAEVKAKADEVVYGAATPDAKLQALYGFVSSNVRSIDVPVGVGHYGPLPPEQVLGNLYGDSQDKSALLSAMLRAEGLPASMVLVGTGVDVDQAVPTPAWFNRAITLTHDAAHGDVWLDTVPEVAPYRMLERSLRGRLALVIPAEGPPVLRRTPADAPFAEFTRFEAVGTLSDTGALSAHVDLTLRGGEELLYRQGLRDLGPAQWDRLGAFSLRRAGLPGQVSNTTADQPERTDTPLHLGYDYTREDFGDWENFRIVPLMPALDLPMANRKTAPGPAAGTGIELSKRTDTAISRIALPADYSADLPAPMHLQTAFATLNTAYRLEKKDDRQALVMERTLDVKVDELPAGQWPEYRKFLDAAAKSNPVLQLTSIEAHRGPGHYPPATGENNPGAAALVGEANEALAARDWPGATATLDAAKAINAHQPLLWSSYGSVALGTNKPEEAVEDLRHELKDHPAEAGVSHRLAGLLEQQGKPAEAAAVLRTALETDPQDEVSARYLANLLEKADPVAAESTLRAGLTASPGNLALELALGEQLLREGKRDEGVRMLSAVATGSAKPEQLNDAAYVLAGAGASLPVAESAARRAMQMLNAEAARGVNGVGSAADLRHSAELVSAWDTYGWVLFQEGSYSEAEPWLRAAWVDSGSVTVGAHWAKLLQKQGKAAEATRVLVVAAHGERGEAGAEDLPAPADTVRASRGRKGAAVQGTARSAGPRTFSVERGVGDANGTAVFELDYWLGGPTVARLVSGDEGLEGMADAIAQIDTGTMIPPGSAGHLLRRGVLTCGAADTCSFRLMSFREAAERFAFGP